MGSMRRDNSRRNISFMGNARDKVAHPHRAVRIELHVRTFRVRRKPQAANREDVLHATSTAAGFFANKSCSCTKAWAVKTNVTITIAFANFEFDYKHVYNFNRRWLPKAMAKQDRQKSLRCRLAPFLKA